MPAKFGRITRHLAAPILLRFPESDADFGTADLDGASPIKTVLEGADLRGTDTGTAIFLGATTAGCRGCSSFPPRELR